MTEWNLIDVLRIVMPVVGIVCAIVFVPWAWFWTWVAPLPNTVQEEVDDAMHRGLDGIIIYVDRTGQSPSTYTAGWKDRDQQIPMAAGTLFKIASISKLYIAAATVKQVHAGALSLDDTLAVLLPTVADRISNADTITLRMLLRHRSGIPNFTDDPDFSWTEPPTDTKAAIELVFDERERFTPDTRYQYSNTNYVLIGYILDKVLGYHHQQYIREVILQPLGLNHTYGQLDDVDLDDVASGYFHNYEPDLKTTDYLLPGGSMISTAEDVSLFLRALVSGSVFSHEERLLYESVYPYEHTGEIPGYQSIARYHPDIDAIVVQLVNTNGGNTVMMHTATYRRVVNILRKSVTNPPN
ncbi:MAG: serine hydrolase domain-containing protein [Pseudomonadota bacterium]